MEWDVTVGVGGFTGVISSSRLLGTWTSRKASVPSFSCSVVDLMFGTFR